MIPLAKILACVKTSLPLKSEARQGVYSHYACSIVVLVDMGMTASLKKKQQQQHQSVCISGTYLSC